MNVSFITHYSGLYGANRSLLALIDGLSGYGVTSRVICRRKGPLTGELAKRQIPQEYPEFKWWFGWNSSFKDVLWRFRRNLSALPEMAGILRSWNTDIVYSNSSVVSIGAMVSALMPKPHVWHLREFGDIDFGGRWDYGRWLTRATIKSADLIIPVSRALRNHWDLKQNKNVQVVYNGVVSEAQCEHNREQANAKPHRDINTFSFLMVACLAEAKGQHEAIEALGILAHRMPNKDIYLTLLGDGDVDYTERCKRIAAEKGVAAKVEFRGYVEDVWGAYLSHQALLVCSRCEAMGRSTAEAMAACCPVIGRNSGGTPELIEHEKTGLLYNGGAQELAACMMRFVENEEWARALGMRAWSVARERFTIESYSGRIHELLMNL